MKNSALFLMGMLLVVLTSALVSAAIIPVVTPVDMYEIPNSAPARIATDSTGRLYVTDPDRSLVHMYSNNGVFLGSIDSIRSPLAVAVDSTLKQIYISDLASKNVGAYGRDGRQLFVVGSGNGEFILPNDMAVAQNGNIYIVDSMVNAVKVYSSSGTFLFSFGSGHLNFPTSVAIAESTGAVPSEEVYVLDHNNVAIRIYGLNGQLKQTISGGGGMFGGGKFLRPLGIAVQGENLYLTDAYNSVVAVYHRGGLFLKYVGNYGDKLGEFKTPTDVVIDKNGKMFVTNTNDQRIEVFGIDSFTSLTVEPNVMNASAYKNGSTITQTVELTSSGGAIEWTAQKSDSWLSISASSGTTPASIVVTLNPYGLPVGTHTSEVRFTDPSGIKSFLVVNLEIKQPVIPTLNVAPSSVHLVYQKNGPMEASDTASVSSSVTGLSWNASVSGNWLKMDKTSGVAPDSIQVSLADAVKNLNPGSYQASMTVSANGASGSPATVAVSLDVISAGTIKVTSNLDEAGFSISGPGSFSGGGLMWSAENVAPGTYTISFAHVSGYRKPLVRTFTVESGKTSEITGVYTEKPVADHIIAGSGQPNGNTVAILSLDGVLQFTIAPFASATNGVRVMSGDMGGDGVDEIILTNGINTMKVFGANGVEIAGYVFNGATGLRAAASDIDGDGKAEIVASYIIPAANRTEIASFALNASQLVQKNILLSSSRQIDLSVALGDINGDGITDLIVASKGQLRAYAIIASQLTLLWSRPITGTVAPRLAAGDINDDGIDEIVMALGPDVSNASIIAVLNGNGSDSGLVIEAFAGYAFGANIALGDTDGDGAAEMAAGAGPGPANESLVSLFDNTGNYLDTINALNSLYGVNVSFGKLTD